MLGGKRLIDLDAPAGTLIDPCIAVSNLGDAMKYILYDRRVVDMLMNAKITYMIYARGELFRNNFIL